MSNSEESKPKFDLPTNGTLNFSQAEPENNANSRPTVNNNQQIDISSIVDLLKKVSLENGELDPEANDPQQPVTDIKFELTDNERVLRLTNGLSGYLDENSEALIGNVRTYMAFDSCLLLRTHTSVSRYTDRIVQVPMILESGRARRYLSFGLSLLQNHLRILNTSVPITSSIEEAVYAMFQEVESLNFYMGSDEMSKTIKMAFDSMKSMVNLSQLGLGIRESNIVPIEVATKGNLRGDFQYLFEYLTLYLTYDDTLIEHHSMNNNHHMLLIILYSMILSETIQHVQVPCTSDELMFHQIFAFGIDCVTHRHFRTLFVEERNTNAVAIKKHIKKLVPMDIRTPEHAKQALMQYGELNGVDTDLYPYYYLFGLNEKDRIMFMFRLYMNSVVAHGKKIDLTPNDFWALLLTLSRCDKSATGWLTEDRYVKEKIVHMLPTLQALAKNEAADIVNSFNK